MFNGYGESIGKSLLFFPGIENVRNRSLTENEFINKFNYWSIFKIATTRIKSISLWKDRDGYLVNSNSEVVLNTLSEFWKLTQEYSYTVKK